MKNINLINIPFKTNPYKGKSNIIKIYYKNLDIPINKIKISRKIKFQDFKGVPNLISSKDL